MHITLSVLWAFAAAGIAWCCLRAASRITYITLANGQRMTRKLPILIRLMLPLSPNLGFIFDRPIFKDTRKNIEKKLVTSGLDEILTPADYLGLQVLVPVVLGSLLAGLVWLALPTIPGRFGRMIMERGWILYTVSFVLAILYPSAWLQRELKERHKQIQRAMPFILDLLTLSVEAGMDFMSALQRIVERRVVDPLSEELIRVLRAIQLGKTRRDALREMSDRIKHSDVRSITNALVQADEMGVSIGSILRIQADQIRGRRFQRAEKLAHEAPIKMLLPLIAFIFPAVFLVLLGPVFLQMFTQWL